MHVAYMSLVNTIDINMQEIEKKQLLVLFVPQGIKDVTAQINNKCVSQEGK